MAKRSNLKIFEMIKLKTEVNKSAVMRELQAKAIEGFKNSWQPELQAQAYMNGVHDLFKLLRLANVSERYSKDDIRKYGNDWKITTWDEGQQRRRIMAEGYKTKDEAEHDMEIFNAR